VLNPEEIKNEEYKSDQQTVEVEEKKKEITIVDDLAVSNTGKAKFTVRKKETVQ
jgi:hypothetical protein